MPSAAPFTSRLATRHIYIALVLGLLLCSSPQPLAQQKPLAIRVAQSAMERWPNGNISPNTATAPWGFEPGIVLAGFTELWSATHDPAYLGYIRQAINQYVQPNGSIRTYDPDAYALNNLLLGRQLLLLYRVTHEDRYRKAASLLHHQITSQPHTTSGGFWHAQATPNLMLLDDEFMLAPFAAEYAHTFHTPQDFAAIATQFILLAKHARDPKTDLLKHAWDETHDAPWANPDTGASANPWARGMGWYLMALVDTLPNLPPADPHRASLLTILNRTAAAIASTQDATTGLWYQILDKPGQSENSIESSSVLMFTYALHKGMRLGYLPAQYSQVADRAWAAIQSRFVHSTPTGAIMITGTVTHIAMGATPQNDGSYAYYLHAPIVSDDPKGIGAFLLAASEMELFRKIH